MLGHLLNRRQARELAFHEWSEVTSLSLYSSHRLLNDYIKAGTEVPSIVNEQLRTRQLGCWRAAQMARMAWTSISVVEAPATTQKMSRKSKRALVIVVTFTFGI